MSQRPCIKRPDGSLDFRQPTDIVIIAMYYGTDIAGARFLMKDGRLSDRNNPGLAAEYIRPEAEAKVAALEQRSAGMKAHLWVRRTAQEETSAAGDSL